MAQILVYGTRSSLDQRRAALSDAIHAAVMTALPVTERKLYSLYVLAVHYAVGEALLDGALPPGTPAQLWVTTENPRARRFHERNGFLADGASHVDTQLDVPELQMVRGSGSR